jgi:hypothetical protein
MAKKVGAQPGNLNAAHEHTKLFDAAIKKVIADKGKDAKGVSIALFNLAQKQYDMGMDGDIQAQNAFLDRYVGKVKQTVESEHTQYIVQIGGEEVPINPREEEDVRH